MVKIFPSAPAWFTETIKAKSHEGRVTFRNKSIVYRTWGNHDNPALVFIHGSGAHSHWWDHIAPFFSKINYSVAIDLPGMGDSDHFGAYPVDLFSDAVLAVVDKLELNQKTILIGHSFGGYVALNSGYEYPDNFLGIIMMDSPVRPSDYKWEESGASATIRKKRHYENLETILSRFRLLPEQPCEYDFILDYIASHSVTETGQGWTWKFDENLLKNFDRGNLEGQLSAINCRVAVLYGEQSLIFSPDVANFMYQKMQKKAPFAGIPEAGHHLICDQPLACVAALRCLIADWRHSRPLTVDS